MKSRNSTNRHIKSNDGGRLSKTLILITIFFILFTSPAAIFYIFFGKRIKRHRDLITMSLSNLATTSHVSSFIIYWLISSDFRDAAISILFCSPVAAARRVPTTEEDKRISSQLSKTECERKLPLVQSSITSD